jgi:hypothetical protein
MRTKDEIKKILLEVAGNPISGAIYEWAEVAAVALSKPDVADSDEDGNHSAVATRETRITKPTETR